MTEGSASRPAEVGAADAFAAGEVIDWIALINESNQAPRDTTRAETYHQTFSSGTRPALLACDDEELYVVKGRQHGAVIVNEQIVARLGHALGAPVPPVAFVDLTAELINLEPELSAMQPGVAHGSRFQAGCTNAEGVSRYDLPANRQRFAALAVLYTWTGADDRQFIYDKQSGLVFSVDHGGFGVRGLHGSVSALDSTFDTCGFESTELAAARAALESIVPGEIARAVAAPLDAWGIALDERVAVATNLRRRQRELVTILSSA